MTADCVVCGRVDVTRGERIVRGKVVERIRCARRMREYSRERGYDDEGYRKFVGTKCERCGFEHEDRGVFDGHHRDRDRTNGAAENIATLCPTCHRLIHRGH